MEEYKKEEGEIKEAIEQLEEMSADEKEREMYEARQKAIWVYNSGMYDATQKGLKQGRIEEKTEIAKQIVGNEIAYRTDCKNY